jgi:hypothetical protein
MSDESLNVAVSTLNSLNDFEFTGEMPKVGDTIYLVNKRTGQKKKILVEFVEPHKRGFVIKNSNVTLRLIRK